MLVCLLLLVRFTLRLPEESLSGVFRKIENFTQKLDHFDPTSKETFPQRYAVNDTFHRGPENGKIILYISGEQHMSTSPVSNSVFVQVANDTGAVMATLEHRFYGLSVPLDLTLGNLTKYHNTDQALEDLADFVVFLKEQYCAKTAECPVLIVGGSYAGSMSSFFRQKYPHLAKYSWSSSPPLDIHNNFSEYDDHLATVIKATSELCYNNTVEMMNEIDRIVREGGEEYGELRVKMGLEGTDSNYSTSVLSMFADQLAWMIQYMTRSSDLRDFCINQTKSSKYDLQSFIDYFRATNPDPAAADSLLLTNVSRFSDMVDSRSWTWQTCNEYGWFQTASGRLRSSWVNLSYYELICETLFNGTKLPDQSSIRQRYGGVNPKTTNIVFAYGAVDPWTRLGVDFETDIVDNVPVHDSLNRYAFFIENSSHCSELSLEQENDSDDLKMKRRMIQQIVTNWLNDDCPSRCQNGDCISGVCVCHENYRGDRCDTRTISSNIFKACSSLLVLVPTVMMIVVGISAWHLFKKDRSENEIRTIA